MKSTKERSYVSLFLAVGNGSTDWNIRVGRPGPTPHFLLALASPSLLIYQTHLF